MKHGIRPCYDSVIAYSLRGNFGTFRPILPIKASEEHTMSMGRISGFSRCAVVLGLLAALTAGCQQYATYPPVEITAKLQRPAAEPVPTIIATSVQYARDNFVASKTLPINLPEGVPPSVYDKVFTHLGGGQPLQSPEEEAIHITEIRTRGMDAQVDMTYPRTDGLYQLVTLTLQHSLMQKWHVKSMRKWALRDVEAPKPNYVARPAPPPTPTQEPTETASMPMPEPGTQSPPAPESSHEPKTTTLVPEISPITLSPTEEPGTSP